MIQSGRSQLKGLLEDLVLQSTEENNKEPSPLEVDEDVEEAARELLEYSSPRKLHNLAVKPSRKTRKRTQRNSTSTDAVFNDEDTYLSSNDPITIYGRQLSLSRLKDNPSLYTVGREWVKNDPYGQRDERPPHTLSDSESDMYSLPTPDLSLSDTTSLPPPPVCQPKIDFNRMDAALKTGLTSEEFVSLREEHIQKWKAIRERHRQRSLAKQKMHSIMIKELHELSQR